MPQSIPYAPARLSLFLMPQRISLFFMGYIQISWLIGTGKKSENGQSSGLVLLLFIQIFIINKIGLDQTVGSDYKETFNRRIATDWVGFRLPKYHYCIM